MTVAAQQKKLLEKLNLDGLNNWTPRNAASARELILAFHDIFMLDRNELGYMSAIEDESCINDSEHFKEWFRCIPLPLLKEVCTSLRDMLDMGGDTPQPVSVVQCGSIGSEKGWNSALLHRFPQAQCVYQKGLIPAAVDTGSAGEHGGCHTFLNNGL